MAYKISDPPDLQLGDPLGVAYNVTMAVGEGKPNIDEDVMLVQLCLQQICAHAPLWRQMITPDGKKIEADGKCGPITKNAIWRFQTELQRHTTVYADGVVGPFTGSTTTAAGHEYTLLWLNYLLFYSIGEDRFEDLADQSFTPPLLKSKLHSPK